MGVQPTAVYGKRYRTGVFWGHFAATRFFEHCIKEGKVRLCIHHGRTEGRTDEDMIFYLLEWNGME